MKNKIYNKHNAVAFSTGEYKNRYKSVKSRHGWVSIGV